MTVKTKRKSFFNRLVFIYFLILFIPCIAMGLVSLGKAQQEEKQKQTELVKAQAENLVSKLDGTLVSYVGFLDKISVYRWVQSSYSTSEQLDLFHNYSALSSAKDNLSFLTYSFDLSESVCLYVPEKERIVTKGAWWRENAYFESLELITPREELSRMIRDTSYLSCHIVEREDTRNLLLIKGAELNINPRAYFLVWLTDENIGAFLKNIKNDYITDFSIRSGDALLYQLAPDAENSGNTEEFRFTSSVLGWDYTVTADFDQVLTRPFSLNTVLLLFGLTLLGIVTVYFSAKITYKPIRNILKNLDLLTTVKSNDISEFQAIQNMFETMNETNEELMQSVDTYYEGAKNTFLADLLNGSFSFTAEEEIKNYRIPFTDDDYYSVAIVSDIDAGERLKAYLFIRRFLQSNSFEAEIVNTIANNIIIILKLSRPDFTKKQEKLLNSMVNELNALDDMTTRAELFLGEPHQGFIGISTSYQNNRQRQLCFSNHQNVLDSAPSVYYPTDWEVQLINNLKLKKQDQVLKILSQIKIENDKIGLSERLQKKLLGLILDTVTRVADEMDYSSDAFMEKLYEIYSADYKEQWPLLIDIIEMVINSDGNSDPADRENFPSAVRDYVDANFADPNLSLKSIQQEFDIPISTIFRMFKNATGFSFYEYLCTLRIDKAKELISGGSGDAKEIAAQTGYDNVKTFYRVFQKQTGQSFREYKQNNKK